MQNNYLYQLPMIIMVKRKSVDNWWILLKRSLTWPATQSIESEVIILCLQFCRGHSYYYYCGLPKKEEKSRFSIQHFLPPSQSIFHGTTLCDPWISALPCFLHCICPCPRPWSALVTVWTWKSRHINTFIWINKGLFGLALLCVMCESHKLYLR